MLTYDKIVRWNIYKDNTMGIVYSSEDVVINDFPKETRYYTIDKEWMVVIPYYEIIQFELMLHIDRGRS